MTNKVNIKNSGNGLRASSWGNPHFAPPVITNFITNKVNNVSSLRKISIWSENTATKEGNSNNGFFSIRMSSWCNPQTAPPVATNKAGGDKQ